MHGQKNKREIFVFFCLILYQYDVGTAIFTILRARIDTAVALMIVCKS